MRLATGADMRVTGAGDAAVVCLNGGQASEVPGTWSASVEWLVALMAPRFPSLAFAEVRYRIKSWQVLDLCIEDARAAVGGSTPSEFSSASRWAAPSRRAADEPRVTSVLGLALIPRPRCRPLRGRAWRPPRVARPVPPGIPGVSASLSRRGFERARALGVPAATR
jgi:hypothetical protein